MWQKRGEETTGAGVLVFLISLTLLATHHFLLCVFSKTKKPWCQGNLESSEFKHMDLQIHYGIIHFDVESKG